MHILIRLNVFQLSDVAQFRVLRHLQILQYDAGSHKGRVHVVYTEALEVFYLEVLAQLLSGRLLNEHPIVHLEGARLEMEHGNLLALAALEKQLLGIVSSKQRTDVVGAALGNHKLAGGDIHKGNADGGAAEMHGGQEVVLPGLQHRLTLHHAGRH